MRGLVWVVWLRLDCVVVGVVQGDEHCNSVQVVLAEK